MFFAVLTGGSPAAVEFGVKKKPLAGSPDGLACTARLPLSSASLNWLASLVRGHLKKIGSRWRALPAGEIATIALAAGRSRPAPGPRPEEDHPNGYSSLRRCP
ncbi:hypothetical protein OG734_00630 [Streptomyces sp. NBC_00576]|nr:hypothetical protein OG734_00630 [Streptomyces sp. NBC_00576]